MHPDPTPDYVTDVNHCARCDGTHAGLGFFRFQRSEPDQFDMWAMCPELQEPILLTVREA